MDDRVAIDVVDTGHDALLELLLRPNPDVAQDRAGELGEEALDEVEPGAVLGCEGELETAGRSSGQPSFGFSRGVRGMIVENQFACGAGRISGVNKFEEFDELSTAVAVSDQAVDLPREQINPGQQADSAVAFVLMIARERRARAANRVLSLRWPGFPAFHRKRRSPPTCLLS